MYYSDGTVCRACNNGLAHVDQAVSEDFDVLAFISGVSQKKGRPSEIRSRGNMIGTKGPLGNEISINMGRYPILTHDGTRLGAFGRSDRNIQAIFERDGKIGKVSFSTTFGQKPKFVRGIVKIALSSLAYFLGAEIALSADFDPVRSFVLEGKGNRPILLLASTDTAYRNQAWPPYRSETGYYAVTFRLAALEFCVDLSPEVTLFPMLKNKSFEMYGDSGWTYLPNDV